MTSCNKIVFCNREQDCAGLHHVRDNIFQGWRVRPDVKYEGEF